MTKFSSIFKKSLFKPLFQLINLINLNLLFIKKVTTSFNASGTTTIGITYGNAISIGAQAFIVGDRGCLPGFAGVTIGTTMAGSAQTSSVQMT